MRYSHTEEPPTIHWYDRINNIHPHSWIYFI
jgi:hypothetical protein